MCRFWGDIQWETEEMRCRLCGGVEGQGTVERKETKVRMMRWEAGHCLEPGGQWVET